MSARTRRPALDRFRLAAAVMVVCIHTGPLSSVGDGWDFWLTRVLARTAVPFFLMVTGYFLARSGWKNTGRFLKKTALTYLAAVALYLPLNLYGGGYGPLEWGKKLLIDGTLYHLWYFPAVILGVFIAWGLSRLNRSAALSTAALLYLIGLGGDSYYGLVSSLSGPAAFYEAVFTIFEYARNGLFLAPLFLLLGAAGVTLGRAVSLTGTLLSLAVMTGEGFLLRELDWPRHDSMYLTLPVCMLFLFSLLLGRNRGEDRRARRLSLLIYLLHPWSIVLVRGGAKAVKLTEALVDNSLGHFSAVLALTLASALALDALRPMRPSPTARAWKEIDLDALRHNAEILQSRLAPGCGLMAVVKADGYGHGAPVAAQHLQKSGVSAFAVACLTEGIALRRAGVRGLVLILGHTPAEEVPLLRRWRLTQAVVDEQHGAALNDAGRPVRVHLAIDTGMRRLGIPAEDTDALVRLYGMKNLRITGIFSHLCVSDSPKRPDRDYTRTQLTRFYQAADRLRGHGCDPGRIHIQASYGILNLPPQPCDYARAGIALYGVGSSGAADGVEAGLRPVLSLRARVVCVRTLRPGEGAGYGLDFQARRDTRLAVVSIGYADGLPRELAQNGGRALLHGQSCPMAGRMCMDQLFIDVTDVPQVRPGDIATIIGQDGGLTIRAEEISRRCDTIANELLSRLGGRVGQVVRQESNPCGSIRRARPGNADEPNS